MAGDALAMYPKWRLFLRSRKVSKPRDWYFKLSYRFEIWQAHRQHCCRSACQISERSDNSKYKSRGFETLRDLTERHLFGYWDGAQMAWNTTALAPHWCCQKIANILQTAFSVAFLKLHSTIWCVLIQISLKFHIWDPVDNDVIIGLDTGIL